MDGWMDGMDGWMDGWQAGRQAGRQAVLLCREIVSENSITQRD